MIWGWFAEIPESELGQSIYKLNTETLQYKIKGSPLSISTADGHLTNKDIEEVIDKSNEIICRMRWVFCFWNCFVSVFWFLVGLFLIDIFTFVLYFFEFLIRGAAAPEKQNPNYLSFFAYSFFGVISLFLVYCFLAPLVMCLVSFGQSKPSRQIKELFLRENARMKPRNVEFELGEGFGMPNVFFIRVKTRLPI